MSISSEVINILRVITMDFVSEAVRRSVVSREFENRLKGDTKCWKYDRSEVKGELFFLMMPLLTVSRSQKTSSSAH